MSKHRLTYGNDTTTVTDHLFFLLWRFKLYKHVKQGQPGYLKILAQEWKEFKWHNENK